jgi:hypothetical protein
MVVKIAVKKGKTASSEEAVLESPGTKTTKVTNDNDSPCKYGAAAAAKKKKRGSSNHTFTSNVNEGDVGDNSSISSRSSMNSVSSMDRGDASSNNNKIEGEKSTTYAATANNAAAAATSTRPLSSEDYAVTISSPSDHSREQIDHPYSSPDTLMIGVSIVF